MFCKRSQAQKDYKLYDSIDLKFLEKANIETESVVAGTGGGKQRTTAGIRTLTPWSDMCSKADCGDGYTAVYIY